MTILMNTGGIASTNCFLIADDGSKQAVLFDAPNDTTRPLLHEAQKRGWRVIGLWLTHGHFDHVADHAVVTEAFPEARVLIHRLDEAKLLDPVSRFLPLPFKIPARRADGYVEDGQSLAIGRVHVEVIHTPGHSPGHVMYHFPQEDVLVGGDLIIMGAVGRTDLPDADEATLYNSVRRVMLLPESTRLLPGHGQASTLRSEKENNPYVKEALSGVNG